MRKRSARMAVRKKPAPPRKVPATYKAAGANVKESRIGRGKGYGPK